MWFQKSRPEDEERQRLLDVRSEHESHETEPHDAHSVLSADVSADEDSYQSDDSSEDEDDYIKKLQKKRLEDAGNWWTYVRGFSIFLPYLLPRKDRKVQACLAIGVLCLLGNRALNILIPRQLGIIANKLIAHEIPYVDLGVWFIFRLLSGESGLDFVRELVKIPIRQFSYRQITNAAFQHVMNLSMDFHSDRDSAEVMKAIEQGESLNDLLEAALMEIAPTVIDLLIAFVYLARRFDIYTCLVMFIASALYITVDVLTSKLNFPNRRRMTWAEAREARIMHQAVQGWETVSYFNRTHHEARRFAKAVETQLSASRDWAKMDAYISALMDLFVPTTFFTLSILVFYQISLNRATPGDYVFLIQYWETLIWPLTWLSSHYRWLLADLIHAERLLILFQTTPTITESPNATTLPDDVTGHIVFNSVHHAYTPNNPTLTDINLTAHPGQTIALVGPTGSGKSTLLSLLLRFHDPTSGTITIDGHNIRNLTLTSLRSAFGVVPQTPLLFNTSIMSNIRYARLDATDSEVHDARRAAALHEKILTFPSGYATRVGENGVKLSGGEAQRLAIARAILRDPAVYVLDEALSAVDSGTEREILDALEGLRRKGKTMFIVAHRLSGVVGADEILVVDGGRVVERGRHEELLGRQGKYAELWEMSKNGRKGAGSEAEKDEG